MDFQSSATKELSGLLDRLIQAADAAARAARAEGAAEAAAEAKITIDAVSAQRATVQKALQEQTEAREALERAKAALEAERETLQRANAALEQERGALTREAEAQRERGDALRTKVDTQHSEMDSLRKEIDALQAHADAQQAESKADLAALQNELESTQSASEALLAESNAAQQELRTQLDEAHREAIETTARAAEWRVEQGRALRDHAVALVSRTLDRMLAVSSAFASVSTEDEVLAAVVEALATEFSRVVLFKVGLDRLDVVQHAGFDFPSDYTHLVIPQGIGAVLDRAVTSGQIELLPAEAIAAANGTPFGGTPACALALPIDLEGDMCAVLYADDSGQPHHAFAATELRRTFALLLRQLASPLLVRLPAETKAISELRAYAAHLVAELENMYDADVAAHRKGNDLRRRLHDNLECARGIYAQRVSSEPPAAAGLLEAELVLAASVAHATPFGRDLTTLLGAAEPRVAEA